MRASPSVRGDQIVFDALIRVAINLARVREHALFKVHLNLQGPDAVTPIEAGLRVEHVLGTKSLDLPVHGAADGKVTVAHAVAVAFEVADASARESDPQMGRDSEGDEQARHCGFRAATFLSGVPQGRP